MQITIREAIPSDATSLGSIHARAFHPANPIHRHALPDTPATRQWWSQRYSDDTGLAPACYIIVGAQQESDDSTLTNASAPAPAPAPAPSPTGNDLNDQDKSIVGVLCLRRMAADERGGGKWSTMAPCPDFDPAFYAAVTSSMVEYREKLMMGREHLMIEHFGVDASTQGSGAGGKILRRVCEIADREGLDTFVEANANAVGFYEKHGFRRHGQEVMPGGYVEWFLVRSAGAVGQK